jgi:hypothetical protein
MAKKDAVSKRLAEEIALAERINEIKDSPSRSLLDLANPDEKEKLAASLWLHEKGPFVGPIHAAFKAFGLDHRSIDDWYNLLAHLARVLFPTPRPPGAPREWTDERLCRLLADVATYKRKNPEASDVAICIWLAKKWSKKPETLRRILQKARNPKHNTELARVVSIAQLRLGPNITVGSVIARADKLWGS